jgi:hypothetical protein
LPMHDFCDTTPQASLERVLVDALSGKLLTEHLFKVWRPVQRTGVRGQYPIEARLHYCSSPEPLFRR